MVWLNFNKPLSTKSLQYDPKYIPKVKSSELKDLLQASYSRNTPAREIGKKYGYTLDDSLSNAEQKVFLDKENNPKIVFTGSRKGADVVTDIALGVGLAGITPRFQRSSKLVDKVKEKYKNKPITAIGDSLGGSLAESVGGKVDKVITTSKGVGLFGIGKQIRPNQTDISASNDVISIFKKTQSGGKKVIIKGTKNIINPWASHDYRNLDKIDKTF
jgi:hypothetical protein